MNLNNVKTIDGDVISIHIKAGKIAAVLPAAIPGSASGLELTFDEALVFPGLINSHDHLDFNLFPALGDRIYNNYTEWGRYIHQHYKHEIAGILKIPRHLRSLWGVYKNLLCGITTVINHEEPSGLKDELITVFEDGHCLHSVQFEQKWRMKLNNPFKLKLPVNIHVGEGSDLAAYIEIDELIDWNLLKKKLIGVHAVAMTERQAAKFKALVWCPQSNYFLLGKTAQIDLLAKQTNILFGTDSTLTSDWNIWNHLRTARKTKLLSDAQLYQSLNKNAAEAWQLNSGEVAAGKDADLVVAKAKDGANNYGSFFNLSPADLLLVIHHGGIRLFDETLLPQLTTVDLNGYSEIWIDDCCKYIQGDLPGLIEQIRSYNFSINFPVTINEHS